MSERVSLQLETVELDINGTVYPLRCNMAVLEKLQDGPGDGSIGNLLNMPSYQVVFEIAKAMIDEACEDDPALPEIPVKQLKKLFNPAQLAKAGIFRLFTQAVAPAIPTQSEQNPVSGADTEAPEAVSPGN